MQGNVYLLPNGHLLLREFEIFSLFDYSAFQEKTIISKSVLQGGPDRLWVCRVVGCPIKAVMEVFFVGNTIQAVVSGDRFLFALVIEEGSPGLPGSYGVVQLVRLPGYIFNTRVSLGKDHAVTIDNQTKEFQLITYALTDGINSIVSPSYVSKYPLSALPLVSPHPLMDEDTGRIVIPRSFLKREAVVIDFSLFKGSH